MNRIAYLRQEREKMQERLEDVAYLRRRGFTLQQIGDKLGVSKARAGQLVQKARAWDLLE